MTLEGQKVLVTGADGFIGSHLAELLVESGCAVTALAQYDSFGRNGWLDDLPKDIYSSIYVKRGDIRDSGFIDHLVDGQDIVLHLAALIAIPYSYDAPQSYIDVNINGTLNILNAFQLIPFGSAKFLKRFSAANFEFAYIDLG